VAGGEVGGGGGGAGGEAVYGSVAGGASVVVVVVEGNTGVGPGAEPETTVMSNVSLEKWNRQSYNVKGGGLQLTEHRVV
jgi:hypothetical protein